MESTCCHVSHRCNALARSERQVLGWADGFTEPTFRTPVKGGVDGRRFLKVLQINAIVVGQNCVRVKNAVGIDQLLNIPHDPIQFRAVLAFDKWCHDSTGPVFRLERPFPAQNEVNHVLGKALIFSRTVIPERIGQHEVDISVLGMPKDHGIFISELIKKNRSFLARVGEFCHGDGHVLQERRAAAGASTSHRCVKPFTEAP